MPDIAQPSAQEIPAVTDVDYDLETPSSPKHLTATIGKVAPVRLTWKNAKYSVKVKAQVDGKKQLVDKELLHGVTGYANPGQLLCIMGSSGAGKTTLMSLLAGKLVGGKTSGDILLNGEPSTARVLNQVAGFVFQEESLMHTQTVREALMLAAKLRLSRDISLEEKTRRVEDVMTTLGIAHCADTLIGSTTIKGISGGEKKRLAIAIELVSNPSILFLDEPTSGLDSLTALSVMATLRLLARQGRTVITTIHQPSSEVFHMFDKLLLLAHGQTVFMGPALDVVPYLGRLGFPCPRYSNPADHLFLNVLEKMEDGSLTTLPDFAKGSLLALENNAMREYAQTELGVEISDKDDDEQVKQKVEELFAARPKSLQGFVDHFEESQYQKDVLEEVDNGHNPHRLRVDQLPAKATFWTQVKVLSSRAFWNVIRDKMLFGVRLGQNVFMALMVAAIYGSLGNDQTSVQNTLSLLFFVSANQAMNSVMGVVSVFHVERPVFLREKENHMYTTGSYFLSKTLVELPFNIVLPIVFTAVLYFIVGLHGTFEAYCKHTLLVILMANAGQSIGMLIGAGTNNINTGLVIAPASVLPMMIFSGFFVNLSSSAVIFSWMEWVSFMRYGFEGIVRTEFEHRTLTCTAEQLVGPNKICPITAGQQVIDNLGFDLAYWTDVGVLVALFVGFRILAYFALRFATRKH